MPGANWAGDIEKAITGCDSVLAVLTRAYIGSDICRAEHMRALREGKLVIPLLFDPGADRPLALEHLNYQDFTDAGRYPESFRNLLRAFSNGAAPSLPKPFHSTFVNAPPLPPAYVQRPSELKTLQNMVIGEDGSRQVALTALEGMGGVGKSALAAALCHDAVVQAAFPDGVIWVTIGRTPGNLVSQMRSIGLVFGDKPEYYETTETSAARLRQVLRGKAALIVLDDVWDRQHVEPFLTSESRCRTLFTSRDRAIGLGLGAGEVRLGTFTRDQAIALLTEWAGAPDPAFAEIAQCCGHLALALKLAGALLKEGLTASEWLKRFRTNPLQMKLGVRAHTPQDDLTTCFDLSLDRYQPREQELYCSLGIFPEDLQIPVPVVGRLWRDIDSGLTEGRCRDLIEDFSRMELLDIDTENRISLHDLLQEYTLAKLNGRAPATHQRLLDSYRGPQQPWWSVPDDGYFYRHAAHHFVGGNRREDLERLLLDFRWLRAKLAATEPVALIDDFDRTADSSQLRMVQSAIRLSAHVLIRDRDQLPAQLTGRLLGHGLLASTVRYMPQPWLRPLARSLRGADSGLLRTLSGHTGGVSSVILTPDESVAISASFDGTIKIWDWRRGIELRTLTGHTRQVNSLAITPDGRRLISGSSDYRVKIWDLESGTIVRTMSDDWAVARVAVSSDGTRVRASGLDGRACAWTLGTWERAADDEQWPPPAREIKAASASHPSYVYATAATEDGKYAITAHDDHALRVWDLQAADSERPMDLGRRPSLIAALPGGRTIASTCPDGALRIWNPRRNRGRRLLFKPPPLVGLRSSLTGLSLVAITWDLKVRCYDRLFGMPLPAPFALWTWLLSQVVSFYLFGKRMVAVAATSPAGNLAFSSNESRWAELSLWTGWGSGSKGKHRSTITALAVSASGLYVVSGSEDGEIKLWSSRTLKEVLTVEAHPGGVSTVAIGANGRRIASAGLTDQTVKVWDGRSGKLLAALTVDCAIQSCAMNLWGNRIVVCDVSGRLHPLRLEPGR